jgi:syntaxin-binding protein 5
VQALLAVGTIESPFDGGQIYVFGQRRTCVKLPLPRKGSVKTLQFCGDKIICLDAKNELSIYSLEQKKLLSSYTALGFVTAVLTDPALDWAFIGLQNGE